MSGIGEFMRRGDILKKIRLIYYLLICILVFAGTVFVKAARHTDGGSLSESLRYKPVVIYGSNFKRQYINSPAAGTPDIEKLGAEGAGILREGGTDAEFLAVPENGLDPYGASAALLKGRLKSGRDCILLDLGRAQTKHGSRFIIGGDTYCPINMIVAKNSDSVDKSILFAGRIKYIINSGYKELPVYITESDGGDYNQGMGYIGLTVEIGDAANTFAEAETTSSMFFAAVGDAISEHD